MKVKDIIITALRFIGREDVSEKLKAGAVMGGGSADGDNGETEVFTTEESEVIDTLLYCFNSVEDELARCYLPLETEEKMTSQSGVYPFGIFQKRPVKIISVKSGKKNVKYSLSQKSLNCDSGEITVRYGFAPVKKDLNGESEFSTLLSNERLVAAGTASEYCLIDGEAKLSAVWESVYRGEIEHVQRTRLSGLRLPPRRWV